MEIKGDGTDGVLRPVGRLLPKRELLAFAGN
jgi:hypothetical protein